MKMKPIWKPIKDYAPFCPICNEELEGNNSMISPYKCVCGVWQSTWQEPLEFTIKPKHD